MSQANTSGVPMQGTRKKGGTMDWLIADAAKSPGVAPVDPSWFAGGTALALAFAVLFGVFVAVVVYVVAVDRSD